MSKKIKADEMSNELVRLLTNYTEEVTEIAKDVVDEIAQGVMDETKSHISWHDKVYSNSFALKKSFEDKRNKRMTWYVKAPHYRLTHLLEFGHITRRIKNGKARTDKFPHVRYGDEFVKNNLEKRLKEAIENARVETNS